MTFINSLAAFPPTESSALTTGAPPVKAATLRGPRRVLRRQHVPNPFGLQLGHRLLAPDQPQHVDPALFASATTRRPTAPLAAFWIIQSPAFRSRSSSDMQALKGIASS
jgi:hypothetical protein